MDDTVVTPPVPLRVCPFDGAPAQMSSFVARKNEGKAWCAFIRCTACNCERGVIIDITEKLTAVGAKAAADAGVIECWNTRKTEDVLIGTLNSLRMVHDTREEDSWYACPKSGECCNDAKPKDECDCGADETNAKIDAALGLKPGETITAERSAEVAAKFKKACAHPYGCVIRGKWSCMLCGEPL